ncbi:hypothetical protein [Variovorax paradoxus]|uniref:Uncharacterized protein n=1 Tax=Variovorax paradoxus (strain EPS) TaxID=595537 RepID=E6V9W0_VARPE|nr:hypothetical protein [Variovorax paradoxus]ADU36248.1 hypothetical protein Varpa_2041 [Variovorax paradoxus EPS]
MTMVLKVPGANPEEIAKGLRAAQAVLDAAGVTDVQGAWGLHELESFDDSLGRSAKPRPGAVGAAFALAQARKAALAACCEGWGQLPRPGQWTLDVLV